MAKLSVNLNKFALIRNSRDINLPDVLNMAGRIIKSGAHGITVHPRPDQRHTRYSDVYDLSGLISDMPEIEFNIEGNPIKKFLEVAGETRPEQCTLVPDAEDQLTSDHGWDLVNEGRKLVPIIRELRECGIRVSLFLDTDLKQIDAAREIGTDRIELYTEPYARAFGTDREEEVVQKYAGAAAHARDIGLGVNAGHDLNLSNLGRFLSSVPGILEVSIGHALVVECFDYTLENTIKKYISILSENNS